MATSLGQSFPLFSRILCFCCFVTVYSQRNTGGLNLKQLQDGEKLAQILASDGYFADLEQEKVEPFGGISIETEAKKLGATLRWLSNEEVGVLKMQVIVKGPMASVTFKCSYVLK